MILKASQRGGGKQLAMHLTRRDENEHVALHEIRGFVSNDIVGAFKEAHAVSCGTRCKQFLFSVSLSPPPDERVDIEMFEQAIARIEEKNRLTGQPRVVVFHEKEGRRHAHAVWSRIDAESMTAKNLPHFKMKLRDLSREIYLEQGWKLPRGLMNSREADPRNYTLDEWQQSKRHGANARDLKDIMQECWAASDSKAAFAQALKARGFTLAQGERRGHVALSPDGQVLSIARYTGKKTKEVRERLGKPDDLPTVDAAKATLAQDLTETFKRHRTEANIQKRQALSPLDAKRRAMVDAQRRERSKLNTGQQKRWLDETRSRANRFEVGVKGLWNALTGKNAAIQKTNEREAYAALARDRAQREALIAAQMRERRSLQIEIASVRERHAELLKALRNDAKTIRTLKAEKTASRSSKKLNVKTDKPARNSPAKRDKDPAVERKPSNEQARTPRTTEDKLEALRKKTPGQRPKGRDKDFDRER